MGAAPGSFPAHPSLGPFLWVICSVSLELVAPKPMGSLSSALNSSRFQVPVPGGEAAGRERASASVRSRSERGGQPRVNKSSDAESPVPGGERLYFILFSHIRFCSWQTSPREKALKRGFVPAWLSPADVSFQECRQMY